MTDSLKDLVNYRPDKSEYIQALELKIEEAAEGMWELIRYNEEAEAAYEEARRKMSANASNLSLAQKHYEDLKTNYFYLTGEEYCG